MSAENLRQLQDGRATVAALARRLLPLWCTLLAFALAPLGTLGRDLWTDEAFTASYLLHPNLASFLTDLAKNEEAPPLYFLVTWAWGAAFGQDAQTLRLLSLLCGLAAVALTTWLVQRWRGWEEGLVAGLTLGLSQLLGAYLVEARLYAFQMLLAVICMALFERYLREPTRMSRALAYGLAALALAMTGYFSASLLIAQNLVVAARLLRDPAGRRARLLPWCAAMAIVAAGVLPWLPTLRYQLEVASASAPPRSAPSELFWLALCILQNVPPRSSWLALWLVVGTVAWLFLLVGLVRSRGQDGGLALRTFGIPALIMLLILIVIRAAATRYITVLLPGAALAIAAGWTALRARTGRLAPVLLAVLLGGSLAYQVALAVAPGSVKSPGMPDAGRPWTRLAPLVAGAADPRTDAVLFHPPWDQRIFELTYKGPELPLLGVHHYDDFYYTQGYIIDKTWTTDEALAAIGDRRRVWVFYDQLHHAVPPLELPPFRQVGRWEADGLTLMLYERR